MHHPLTIPELDPATAEWIVQEAQRSSVSVEIVVRRLIQRGVEVERKTAEQEIHHDLDALAGTWSAEEASDFLQAVEDFSQIDPTLWH